MQSDTNSGWLVSELNWIIPGGVRIVGLIKWNIITEAYGGLVYVTVTSDKKEKTCYQEKSHLVSLLFNFHVSFLYTLYINTLKPYHM